MKNIMDRSNKKPLEGIVPPLITPLLSRDQLDVAGHERLIEHVLKGGVHALFILGTSGEAPSLSYRLRRDLISRTCKIVAGRVPVLVGITDTSLEEALGVARSAAEAGAQAVVSSTPYYFPSGQSELISFFRQLVEELPLPLYLYNMPMMTKTPFEPDTVRQLAQLEGIIGVKDSSGDINYFRQVVEVSKIRPDWRLFIGPEHLLVESIRLGGHGGVNGGGQIDPKLLVSLYDAARRGEQAQVSALLQRLSVLGRIYQAGQYASTVIKGMKCALSLMDICSDELAPPMTRFAPAERQKIAKVLQELDLIRSSVSQPAEALT
jgi:dihydrodipicolinate synthase/N-acetylneuraminate lyase